MVIDDVVAMHASRPGSQIGRRIAMRNAQRSQIRNQLGCVAKSKFPVELQAVGRERKLICHRWNQAADQAGTQPLSSAGVTLSSLANTSFPIGRGASGSSSLPRFANRVNPDRLFTRQFTSSPRWPQRSDVV